MLQHKKLSKCTTDKMNKGPLTAIYILLKNKKHGCSCDNMKYINPPQKSLHYSDVLMSAMAYQITGVSIVYSTICSDADQKRHQSSASLAFVRGNHLWLVISPHKGSVTRVMFPFGDVIMVLSHSCIQQAIITPVIQQQQCHSLGVYPSLA